MNDYRAFFDIPGPSAWPPPASPSMPMTSVASVRSPRAGPMVRQDGNAGRSLRRAAPGGQAKYPGKKLFVAGREHGRSGGDDGADPARCRSCRKLVGRRSWWRRRSGRAIPCPGINRRPSGLASHTVPWMTLDRQRPAYHRPPTISKLLIKMSRDPLFIKATRVGGDQGAVRPDGRRDACGAGAESTDPGADRRSGSGGAARSQQDHGRQSLAPEIDVRYYPQDYHMILRDLHGDVPTADIAEWIEQR